MSSKNTLSNLPLFSLLKSHTHTHTKSIYKTLKSPVFKINQHTMAAANSWMVAATFSILLIKSSISPTNAQQTISTPCSSSMISSFTPCLNFVTGSSSSGSSPTQDCCSVLRSLTVNNMDCACLIITGNVPVSIPFINSNFGISLPRACKSSVPLQCKGRVRSK